VVGQDRCDAPRRGALEGVDHDEQLHQMIVHRRTGRLDHEDVLAADVLVDLNLHPAVGEPRDVRVTQRKLECLGDLLRQRSIRVAREELQLVGHVVSRDGISSFVLRRPARLWAYRPCSFMYPLGSPSAAPRQTTAGSRRSDPPDGWGGRNRTSIAGSKAPSPTTERRPSGIMSPGSPLPSSFAPPSRPSPTDSPESGSGAHGPASAPSRTPSAHCPTSYLRALPLPTD